jgi:DNA polymerase-3 subunit alpha
MGEKMEGSKKVIDKGAKKSAPSLSKTKVTASDFVHLHNHTQYSLLDGLTKIGKLVEFVKESGMQAVSITDHGTLSGWIEFYKTCKASVVKPLLGIETYMAHRSLHDKDPSKDRARYHLILIAMNDVGVRNIMQLSTTANLEGFYYFPRIDRELLEKHSEGVIALSGCMGSELGQALKDNRDKDALEVAKWYKKVFGDRYYLEIQDHGHPDNPLHSVEQYEINKKVMVIGDDLGIKCVVTSDAHYLRHEDQEAHEVLLCVGTGSYLSDTKRMSLKEYPLHVAHPDEIISRWGSQHPEYIVATKEIADRVDFDFELGKILIPKFDVPKGETEKSYLDMLTWRGIAWRYGKQDRFNELSIEEARKTLSNEIVERADFELGVIEKMGFNGYFLIIWDFIKWGKDHGIVFGPGRGSAAGSVVSYALRITELDPLKYDLLFERFLNPDRISMPDIDIDIADDRRDEVIEYCRGKYGSNRVANIVTFGKMAARNAIRDTARVLQLPYADADRLSKMVPPPVQGRHIPLSKSLIDSPDLKAEYESNPVSKQIFDMAVQLEGTIRSHGVHAAGVVIAPDDIVKFAPLEMAQKGVVTTQFSMNPIEELGLLKMDFLGLSNLTIIKNCLRIVKKVYKEDIDIGLIPIDDKKTFELLQRADTTGVFQLESAGMKRYLKDLKPSMFGDIIAMVALYRPGPMQFIDSFIKRKHGDEKITFLHPKFENALRETYGVLVYQEQFMQISKDFAGFTGGQADTLRKAVGKKNMDLMRKVRTDFIEGSIEHSGADPALAEKFWIQLEEFANYCFNKSHAACYGLIAYQTAYLKAHYPSAFMAALMTSDWDNIDRLAIEITECKHMGIDVLPPNVNYSFHEFSVADGDDVHGAIRFGMDAIKNVGKGAVEEILRAREDGLFSSINDFVSRVSSRVVNRKTWESLIKTGAMDSFGERGSLLNSLDIILSLATKIQKERSSSQIDLFGASDDPTVSLPDIQLIAPAEPLPNHSLLAWERELLGLYLSHHPLEDYEVFLQDNAVPISEITPDRDGKMAKVGGTISDIRQITTKNGQNMAFVKLEDRTGELELIIFPNLYKESQGLWERDRIILVEGKVAARDKEGVLMQDVKFMPDSARSVTLDEAKDYQPLGKKHSFTDAKKRSWPGKNEEQKIISTPKASGPAKLYLRVIDDTKPGLLQDIKKALDASSGSNEVVLVLGEPAKKQAVKLPFTVSIEETLTRRLADIIGASNVIVQ